jgi:membrane-bound lytic murein transglycosylase D
MQDTRRSSGRTTTTLAANSKKQTKYKVQRGDSLYMVAKRFNVEMQHLKRWNPRVGQALKPGQLLTVSSPR